MGLVGFKYHKWSSRECRQFVRLLPKKSSVNNRHWELLGLSLVVPFCKIEARCSQLCFPLLVETPWCMLVGVGVVFVSVPAYQIRTANLYLYRWRHLNSSECHLCADPRLGLLSKDRGQNLGDAHRLGILGFESCFGHSISTTAACSNRLEAGKHF